MTRTNTQIRTYEVRAIAGSVIEIYNTVSYFEISTQIQLVIWEPIPNTHDEHMPPEEVLWFLYVTHPIGISNCMERQT